MVPRHFEPTLRSNAMHVALIGTGLIGGSVGMALRAQGHTVVGFDSDTDAVVAASEVGAVDTVAASMADAVANAEVVVVAVPVSSAAQMIVAALDLGAPVVTDVGSVKAPVVADVAAQRPNACHRYVGGHPMAGSEQGGVRNARANLFAGAVWIITPTSGTDPATFSIVQHLATECDAETVVLTPERHDALVAVVSHVPQLAATSLMTVAARVNDEDAALLRLAAGGFRDMTRIAASNPAIWSDICIANRDAILDALGAYQLQLDAVRLMVSEGDRSGIESLLQQSRAARRNLPVGFALGGPLSEMRVPVPDRPGVLAEITTLAGQLGINIGDLEIVHSIEGDRGVVVMMMSTAHAETFAAQLAAHGYRPSIAELPE
jgi:prephenate dehydrogenase